MLEKGPGVRGVQKGAQKHSLIRIESIFRDFKTDFLFLAVFFLYGFARGLFELLLNAQDVLVTLELLFVLEYTCDFA